MARRNGAIAEAEVSKKLYELGAIVSSPDYYEAKYDLIADFHGELIRVQVKRAYQRADRENSVSVELRRPNPDGSKRTYSEGDFDALAVYIPSIGNICWFDIAELNTDQLTIYTGDWSDVRPCNKGRMRNYSDNLITERFK